MTLVVVRRSPCGTPPTMRIANKPASESAPGTHRPPERPLFEPPRIRRAERRDPPDLLARVLLRPRVRRRDRSDGPTPPAWRLRSGNAGLSRSVRTHLVGLGGIRHLHGPLRHRRPQRPPPDVAPDRRGAGDRRGGDAGDIRSLGALRHCLWRVPAHSCGSLCDRNPPCSRAAARMHPPGFIGLVEAMRDQPWSGALLTTAALSLLVGFSIWWGF